MKKIVLLAVAVVMILATSLIYSNEPARNIRARRHPNLAAAQRLCQQAYERIKEAQQANEYDMKGHAKRAKELLEQANAELKEAAEAANQKAGK
jgi:hypothetical protein